MLSFLCDDEGGDRKRISRSAFLFPLGYYYWDEISCVQFHWWGCYYTYANAKSAAMMTMRDKEKEEKNTRRYEVKKKVEYHKKKGWSKIEPEYTPTVLPVAFFCVVRLFSQFFFYDREEDFARKSLAVKILL